MTVQPRERAEQFPEGAKLRAELRALPSRGMIWAGAVAIVAAVIASLAIFHRV